MTSITQALPARVPVASKLVRAHAYAAFAGLILSALFGLTVAIKFHVPEFLTNHAALTWGRLRYDHTQGILYAWLGNAFIAIIYYAVPYLTRRPVTSERLGWIMFFIYNFVAILGGWTLVLSGILQPLEWAEFPLVIAAVIETCFALMIVQFCIPFLKCGASELYVSGWYLLGGLTFTFLAYPVGNILPHALPGEMGAAFSGLWIHDAVGIRKFWQLRNTVIHMGISHESFAMRAVDYGLRILRLVQTIPRPSYIVVATVSLFSDEACIIPRHDVMGVNLELFGGRGENFGRHVYPSRRDYVEGTSVSWEWNMTRPGWGETWYREPNSGEIKLASSESLEFIGRPLEQI